VKIFQDFTAQGSEWIIGWGYEFLDAANIVSTENPDIPFAVTCAPMPGSEGYAENLASMYWTEEEPGYLAGILAANLTKSKKVGFISGTDIPCVAKTLNAFRLGANSVDPEVDVEWAFLGSWADVAKERELATALIDMDCDIIFALWIGLATADVCEEEGVYLIGSQYLSEYKPNIVVADHFLDIINATKVMYDDVLAGTYKPVPYQMTMERGYTDLLVNEGLVPNVVSNELTNAIEAAKRSIVQGDLKVPRLVRVLPPEWPQKDIPDYDEYIEPTFPNVYGYDQYAYP
ncbi:BMP family protein, partial [Chloroflexota bacterium]